MGSIQCTTFNIIDDEIEESGMSLPTCREALFSDSVATVLIQDNDSKFLKR